MNEERIVLACPSCLQKNRFPRQRIGDGPVCSSCRTPLLSTHPIELDGRMFDSWVGASDLPVVIDFWASWCGPCRAMAPHFAQAARSMLGRVQFAKVDTEAEQQLAARFAVQGIPLLVLLRGGREIARRTGLVGAAELEAWLASHAG